MSTVNKTCYNAGLKMLVRREHSIYELEQKLQLKEFDEIEISEAIDLLIKQKFQSDERFTEAFIQMRYNQGKGPIKIAGELRQRGIDNFDLSEHDWFGLASSIYQRKYRETVEIDYKEKAKRKRFLQSRGFDMDQISNAVQSQS
jgi:regulatory protein